MKQKIEIKCGIYKITSPSNRIYVGQSINIKKRFKQYINLKNDSQPILYRSFKKHGVLNHIFEIIEECQRNDLNNRERYWQEFYDVVSKNGLNCLLVPTETQSIYFSKELSEKKKVFPINQYTLEGHLVKTWKSTIEIKDVLGYDNNSITGVCRKDRVQDKNQLTHKGFIWKYTHEVLTQKQLDYINSFNIKKIYQYSSDGNLIKIWNSRADVKNTLGKDVTKCLTNKVKRVLGYSWSYKELTSEEVINRCKRNWICRPVLQLDLNNNLIREWESTIQIRKQYKKQVNKYIPDNGSVEKYGCLWEYKYKL